MKITGDLKVLNDRLRKQVDQFSFTDQEYEVLASVMSQIIHEKSITLNRARMWLEPLFENIHFFDSDETIFRLRGTIEIQIKMLECPLHDIPLHINDGNYTSRIISVWRLKIGR
jgi:hypothetical protein